MSINLKPTTQLYWLRIMVQSATNNAVHVYIYIYIYIYDYEASKTWFDALFSLPVFLFVVLVCLTW